jgi:hypothetical protein
MVPGVLAAADILNAWHDPVRDEIVADIAYRGTTSNHDFRLIWGPCHIEDGEPRGIAARVVDVQGREMAREDFVARARFALDGLDCRPAPVTLRMGRVSSETVLVPAAPGSAPRADSGRSGDAAQYER